MKSLANDMIAEYSSGKSIRQVASAFGISTGKTYNILRDAGCNFRQKGVPCGWHHTPDAKRRLSEKHRGLKMNDESRMRLSEAKKCNYNGLNGYGHTKHHRSGYILAYAPCHPNARKDGYVMQHRIIIEQSIGRYLMSNEVVHHKNRIRDDNRIENLRLMDKHEHMSMHMKERRHKGEGQLSIV